MPAPTTSALRTLIGELLPTNTATGSAAVVQVSHRGPFPERRRPPGVVVVGAGQLLLEILPGSVRRGRSSSIEVEHRVITVGTVANIGVSRSVSCDHDSWRQAPS